MLIVKIECESNDVIIPFCSSDVLKRNGLNWIKILNEMKCGLWFHKERFCLSFANLTTFVFRGCLQDGDKGVFHMTFHQTKEECSWIHNFIMSLLFWNVSLEIQKCVHYRQHWRSIHLSFHSHWYWKFTCYCFVFHIPWTTKSVI